MSNIPNRLQIQTMKQLNKAETILYLLGAVLMVVGSGANVFLQPWAPYVFAAGAIAFVLMQLKQKYEGHNFTLRRLRRILMTSDLFFILSAVLMFANMNNLFGLGAIFYVEYVMNKWVVALLVAAVLQLYATHRIGHELEKEAQRETQADEVAKK